MNGNSLCSTDGFKAKPFCPACIKRRLHCRLLEPGHDSTNCHSVGDRWNA